MKVLLLHHRLPYPLNNGMDKVRYNLIEIVSRLHEVHLAIPDLGYEQRDVNRIKSLCAKLHFADVPHSGKVFSRKKNYARKLYYLAVRRMPNYVSANYYPEYSQFTRRLIHETHFDIVQSLSDFTNYYLLGLDQSIYKVSGPNDDMMEESRMSYSLVGGLRSAVGYWLASRAHRYNTGEILSHSDLTLFFSQRDLDRLQLRYPVRRDLRVLRTPVERPGTKCDCSRPTSYPSLVFVGGLGASFNEDAVLYFCRSILPIIRTTIPDVVLYIVGNSPGRNILRLGEDKYTVVTGQVEDVKEYICKATVYIAPIRLGTGFKTKIVEAMSCGKAIVATEKGIQGLWELPEQTIAVADDEQTFAASVIRFLTDEKLRSAYGNNARKAFEKAYSYEVVSRRIIDVYKEIESLATAKRLGRESVPVSS